MADFYSEIATIAKSREETATSTPTMKTISPKARMLVNTMVERISNYKLHKPMIRTCAANGKRYHELYKGDHFAHYCGDVDRRVYMENVADVLVACTEKAWPDFMCDYDDDWSDDCEGRRGVRQGLNASIVLKW
jgi:hypothetical protein